MTGQENKNTRIYTVFFSPGLPVGFAAYRKHHPDIKVMNNQEILERVKDECKDVEFVGTAEPVKAEEAISNTKEQKEDLGGLLVFGPPPDELI